MSAPAMHRVAKRSRDDAIIAKAQSILAGRMAQQRARYTIGGTSAAHDYVHYLLLRFGDLEREHFGVLLLDAQNRVIAFEMLHQGTLAQTAVSPRELARCALRHNAASVIVIHNHPGGTCEFSAMDRTLTEKLRQALDLVDIRLLDALLVADGRIASEAEARAIAELTPVRPRRGKR